MKYIYVISDSKGLYFLTLFLKSNIPIFRLEILQNNISTDKVTTLQQCRKMSPTLKKCSNKYSPILEFDTSVTY